MDIEKIKSLKLELDTVMSKYIIFCERNANDINMNTYKCHNDYQKVAKQLLDCIENEININKKCDHQQVTKCIKCQDTYRRQEYKELAHSYIQIDKYKSAEYFEKATTHYVECRRILAAAFMCRELANIHKDIQNIETSIKCFRKAISLFKEGNRTTKCQFSTDFVKECEEIIEKLINDKSKISVHKN